MDLSSFRSTVKVGDYSVWLFKEGVKPSKTVSLGCIANVNGSTYAKQARWNTDGSVTLIGGTGSSDIVQCFSKIIPVPDGVEFRNPDMPTGTAAFPVLWQCPAIAKTQWACDRDSQRKSNLHSEGYLQCSRYGDHCEWIQTIIGRNHDFSQSCWRRCIRADSSRWANQHVRNDDCRPPLPMARRMADRIAFRNPDSFHESDH